MHFISYSVIYWRHWFWNDLVSWKLREITITSSFYWAEKAGRKSLLVEKAILAAGAVYAFAIKYREQNLWNWSQLFTRRSYFCSALKYVNGKIDNICQKAPNCRKIDYYLTHYQHLITTIILSQVDIV